MIRAYVVQVAFGGDVNHFARRVFHVGFEADGPGGGVDEDALKGDGIGSGVDLAGDVLPVPIQHESDLIALGGGEAPIAGPSAGERMSLLGEDAGAEG